MGPLARKATVFSYVTFNRIVNYPNQVPLVRFFLLTTSICVFPKNRGIPKMDGENKGKPYIKWDDLGGKPTIFGNTQYGLKQPSLQW